MSIPNLTLYDHLLAYFPARARLTMIEKGYPYQHKIVDLLSGDSLSYEFVKMNPKATLPVLKAGDTLICNSIDICEYLDNLDGSPMGGEELKPRVKELTNLMCDWDGNLYGDRFRQGAAAKLLVTIQEHKINVCKQRAKEHPEMKEIYQEKAAYLAKVATEEQKAKNQSDLELILNTCEDALKNSKYLAGNEYTLADILLTCLFVRVASVGRLGEEIKGKEGLSKWYNMIKERPSFKHTFQETLDQKIPVIPVFKAVAEATFANLTGRY